MCVSEPAAAGILQIHEGTLPQASNVLGSPLNNPLSLHTLCVNPHSTPSVSHHLHNPTKASGAANSLTVPLACSCLPCTSLLLQCMPVHLPANLNPLLLLWRWPLLPRCKALLCWAPTPWLQCSCKSRRGRGHTATHHANAAPWDPNLGSPPPALWGATPSDKGWRACGSSREAAWRPPRPTGGHTHFHASCAAQHSGGLRGSLACAA